MAISQEIIDYLRSNLRISVDIEEGYYYDTGSHRLTIELYLDGEIISKTNCNVPVGKT